MDLDLYGRPSYPVVDALMADDMPVLFKTGFSKHAVELRYQNVPRLQKPVDQVALLAALTKAS
ncbi:hypothetical protein [Acidisphaera sp. L21]|uniref:hypothetical protein n=1 Tax=Acidisphaera sp. L21 TaxID=1641851 RepID=UPI00131D20A5|nr:hypothetical protein [Acidisphaera sp. L21]